MAQCDHKNGCEDTVGENARVLRQIRRNSGEIGVISSTNVGRGATRQMPCGAHRILLIPCIHDVPKKLHCQASPSLMYECVYTA